MTTARGQACEELPTPHPPLAQALDFSAAVEALGSPRDQKHDALDGKSIVGKFAGLKKVSEDSFPGSAWERGVHGGVGTISVNG
jgi:hypothetical protein